MAGPADAVRAESAQAPVGALRISEIRRTNYDENKGGSTPGAIVAHNTYAEADLPVTEGAAAWGPWIRVDGFDRLSMLLKSWETAAADITSIHIVAQAAPVDSDEDAYDVYYESAAVGTLARKIWALTQGAAVTVQATWPIPTQGRYMRFKLWATAPTPAGARARLLVKRLMDAS